MTTAYRLRESWDPTSPPSYYFKYATRWVYSAHDNNLIPGAKEGYY